jgi:hypothetical protein
VNSNTNIENILQNLIELYFDHKYKDICAILKIEYNPNHNKNDEPVYKYDKSEEGMIFYNNENPTIHARVYVNKDVKYILNTLLMTTSNLVNEKDIIDLIINKWIKNVHITGLLDSNIILNSKDEDEIRIQVKVSKNSWNNLTKACKNKNILVKTGFRMSIFNYLEEICNNNIELQ